MPKGINLLSSVSKELTQVNNNENVLSRQTYEGMPMALASACPGLPSDFLICFSDVLADNSPEILAVAPGVDLSLALSEHGPCLVRGVITLDNATFTTKMAAHSGANTLTLFGCVALLDTGSPHTFIRHDVLGSMLSVGAASAACERKCVPRSWGGFGESAPLQTSTSVRPSV